MGFALMEILMLDLQLRLFLNLHFTKWLSDTILVDIDVVNVQQMILYVKTQELVLLLFSIKWCLVSITRESLSNKYLSNPISIFPYIEGWEGGFGLVSRSK